MLTRLSVIPNSIPIDRQYINIFIPIYDSLPTNHTHTQVVMCLHRMGMICASSGDHRSAVKLLELSKSRYAGESSTHALAKEAEVGLAIAK